MLEHLGGAAQYFAFSTHGKILQAVKPRVNGPARLVPPCSAIVAIRFK